MPKKPDLTDNELTTLTTATMLGLTDEATLALLQAQHGLIISSRSFTRWKQKHPQVRNAIESGRANSEHNAARTIWTAMTQTHDMNLAFKAAVHWEKSRHGRKDVAEQRIEVTSDDGSAVGVSIYIPHNSRDNVAVSAEQPPQGGEP